MEFIDLGSEEFKDDCSQYIDLNQVGREVFESQPMHAVVKETPVRQQGIDPDIDSKHIPDVNATKIKLKNFHLEEQVQAKPIFKRSNKRKDLPETIEQRLSRIKDELEEIKSMQENSSDSSKLPDLRNIEELYVKLASVSQAQFSNLQGRLSQEGTNVIMPSVTVDANDAQRLLELDQKIRELEAKLGSPGGDDKSLMTKLESLFRQVKLLNNDNDRLGQFHERLTQINKCYEDCLIGRRAKVDSKLYDVMCDKMTTHEAKVNELYKYHSLLKTYGPIFPQLINRIKQISGISDRIFETYELAGALDSSISDLQLQANKWEEVLGQINKKLDQQALDMEKNVHYVNKKLASLDAERQS